MFVSAALLTRLGLAVMAPSLAPSSPRVACQVELQPGNAPHAWIAAAAAVRDSLRERADADRDCRAVVIHASGDRSSVEVVTLDGRHGVRRLADAGDVVATVDALIVTVRADGASPDPRGQSDESVRVEVRPPQLAGPPAEIAPSTGWRIQVVAGGGARFSLPGTGAAQLELGIGVARPGWELGLFGAWAPAAIATGSNTPLAFSSTAEAAIGGAWRPTLGGSGIDLFVGARAGITHLADANTNNMNDPPAAGAGGTGGSQNVDPNYAGVAPAVTGFIGAVFATRSIVHLRPQLWYQWIPKTRFGGSGQDPVTGRLSSVGLSLGVESRLP